MARPACTHTHTLPIRMHIYILLNAPTKEKKKCGDRKKLKVVGLTHSADRTTKFPDGFPQLATWMVILLNTKKHIAEGYFEF